MSWNIIAYLIYSLVTIYTILVIGRHLHSNGIFFIRTVFTDTGTANTVNDLLLLGYYLVNIGYAFITLSSWGSINNFTALVTALSEHIGLIYLLLAILHYNNIYCLRLYAKWNHIDLFTTKTTPNGK